MWFRSILTSPTSQSARPPSRSKKRRFNQRPSTGRLRLETLEDRCLLTFMAPVNYAVGANPQAVVSADFNNDHVPDVAVANSNSTVSVLLANADGTFRPAQSSAAGDGPRSMAVGDFNADGKLDLATANANDVSVLLGKGDGTFQAPTNIYSGPESSLAVGDFNADGKLDLGVLSSVYSLPQSIYGYS